MSSTVPVLDAYDMYDRCDSASDDCTCEAGEVYYLGMPVVHRKKNNRVKEFCELPRRFRYDPLSRLSLRIFSVHVIRLIKTRYK